ncbi:hypothetical protein [Sphingomonas sp.]|uniref:hypothetical protein n=1 Tax=Sphingomonas sp. TaxID=28214 RepID=UPI001AFFA996|nr:hypothetical protein [Sphingomonas sp.]MBO9714347.1 hypothetical protein [Sphingomonas sp.]
MSAPAVLRSSLATSLARYSRSWGLWLLLLVAPIEARLWISSGDEPRAVIAVHDMAPVMTSAVLGVSLGIVISMLLLPVAFLYLRANTTRIQPWQIEEVTAGSRVAMALGRFGADTLILMAVLAAMTLAGWPMGWLMLPRGGFDPLVIAATLWLIAAPALAGVAAVRTLFDAVPIARGAWGEFLFFILWLAAIIVPIVGGQPGTGIAYNLTDFTGFVQPLTYTLKKGDTDIAIGSSSVGRKKIALDVMAGVNSDGYIASRFGWLGISVLVAGVAGLAYAQHKPRRRRRMGWLAKLLAPGKPKAANPAAPPARFAAVPVLGLLAEELRLIAGGRLWLLLALAVTAASAIVDFRHVASPAALLLLVFGLSAHAGRSERGKLLALTRTMRVSPIARRIAFVVAGALWSATMGAPGIVRASTAGNWLPLELAAGTGAAFAAIAMALGAVSRSAFAPRLVLLILWYAYFSAN